MIPHVKVISDLTGPAVCSPRLGHDGVECLPGGGVYIVSRGHSGKMREIVPMSAQGRLDLQDKSALREGCGGSFDVALVGALRHTVKRSYEFPMHTLQRRLRKLTLVGCLVLSPVIMLGSGRPTWAKHATPLDLSCSRPAQRIESPDRRLSIEVMCRPRKDEDPAYWLRIHQDARRTFNVPLQQRTQELLWAPDSKAFLVNGSQAGYWGFFVTVYELAPNGPRKHVITDLAQRDMVASFPPCSAANRDETACARIAKNPEYNMSGVGWGTDSRSVLVFAEVPCSSSYGGIMCQVLGYQLSVPDGRILKRLTAPEVKTQWCDLMGWDMNVPDPPQYVGPDTSH